MIKPEVIKAYTLKNALEHEGTAQLGSIINALFNEGLKKENIKDIIPNVQKIISELNKLSLEEQQKEFEGLKNLIGHREVRKSLPELEHVSKKGVIMRFAPSPSGPLHIGHALTASPSYFYVQKYGGKLFIRIEDTNPENIYFPAYKMIEEEARWLFGKKIKIIIQSQRMKHYYNFLKKLFSKKVAYVCTCSQEQFKVFVTQRKECPCRNLTHNEQLKRWKKMLDKKGYQEGDAVVRFKTNMTHKNPAFRDFPLARINTMPHPLQKNKYRVWPLMNLAVTVDDIETKVTHVIRGKDHKDNAEKQKMIFELMKKKYPESYFLGRIHLKDMELSSSKTRKEIEEGMYKGWDDPHLFTVASLRKQGYTRVAFHKLAEQIGISEVDKTIDKKELLRLLDTFNR